MAIGRDWDRFYAAMVGRTTRPLFDRAMAVWGDRAPGSAIDLGAGDGTETLALLERGWDVLAVDAEPASARIIRDRVPADAASRLRLATATLESADLSPADLIYAGFSLPFQVPTAFARTWASILAALRPNGLVAVNVFGPHDTWHTDPTMTFLDRDAASDLLTGLDVVWFDEREEDGEAVSGPKHWHVIDMIATSPAVDGGHR